MKSQNLEPLLNLLSKEIDSLVSKTEFFRATYRKLAENPTKQNFKDMDRPPTGYVSTISEQVSYIKSVFSGVVLISKKYDHDSSYYLPASKRKGVLINHLNEMIKRVEFLDGYLSEINRAGDIIKKNVMSKDIKGKIKGINQYCKNIKKILKNIRSSLKKELKERLEMTP